MDTMSGSTLFLRAPLEQRKINLIFIFIKYTSRVPYTLSPGGSRSVRSFPVYSHEEHTCYIDLYANRHLARIAGLAMMDTQCYTY